MIIKCQRHLFDMPREVHYLDCAKMSPLALTSVKAGEEGLLRQAHPWTVDASDFFVESERARGLFARLIGAQRDDIAIIPSASYGLAVAAKNVKIGPRQKIIVVGEEFPSTIHTCRVLARERGAELVTVPCPADGDWSGALIDAVDEDTAFVCAVHNHWIHGTLFDLCALSRRCREVGAALALDLTQSAGALPIDIADVDPDYLIAASYKWLFGPYSIGFLYVAPRHHEGQPLEQCWLTRENARDFRRLVEYREQLCLSARRFDMGQRENFALLPVASKGLEMLLDWGVNNISETLGRMTGTILDRLQQNFDVAMPPGTCAPHFLSVTFPHPIADDMTTRLAASRVYISLRGDNMRITPHLYNDDADFDALVKNL